MKTTHISVGDVVLLRKYVRMTRCDEGLLSPLLTSAHTYENFAGAGKDQWVIVKTCISHKQFSTIDLIANRVCAGADLQSPGQEASCKDDLWLALKLRQILPYVPVRINMTQGNLLA